MKVALLCGPQAARDMAKIVLRCLSRMDAEVHVVSNDRATPVGAFLHRTNFDGLPRMINVLKDVMSIVGPCAA